MFMWNKGFSDLPSIDRIAFLDKNLESFKVVDFLLLYFDGLTVTELAEVKNEESFEEGKLHGSLD